MDKYAIWAMLQAKPGKEAEVADFLKSAVPLVQAEPETNAWYAIQLGPSTFGIFDTFAAESGREAHLSGKVAAALMAKAPELLAEPPKIQKIDILATK
jgi:quinol monooxygenase YgiN